MISLQLPINCYIFNNSMFKIIEMLPEVIDFNTFQRKEKKKVTITFVLYRYDISKKSLLNRI